MKKDDLKKVLNNKRKLISVIELFNDGELDLLIERVNEAVSAVREDRKKEAEEREARQKKANELLEMAKEKGINVADLLNAAGISEADIKRDLRRGAGKKRKKVKYRLGEQEWTGAGRPPRWITELRNKGEDIEKYRVD